MSAITSAIQNLKTIDSREPSAVELSFILKMCASPKTAAQFEKTCFILEEGYFSHNRNSLVFLVVLLEVLKHTAELNSPESLGMFMLIFNSGAIEKYDTNTMTFKLNENLRADWKEIHDKLVDSEHFSKLVPPEDTYNEAVNSPGENTRVRVILSLVELAVKSIGTHSKMSNMELFEKLAELRESEEFKLQRRR